MTRSRLGRPVFGLSKRGCWLFAIAICVATWAAIGWLFAILIGAL